MFQRIMIIFGLLGLIVTFQNCAQQGSMEGDGSSNAPLACSDYNKIAFRQTYYASLRTANRCLGCHGDNGSAGNTKLFVTSDFEKSYERFISIGRGRVEQFAIGDHRPPYSGPDYIPTVNRFKPTWDAAEENTAKCTKSVEVVSTEKPMPSNASITTVTDQNAPVGTAPWTVMSWDLEREVKRTVFLGKIKARFSFEIRRVDLPGTGGDVYQVRNPTAQITAPATGVPAVVPTFTFQQLLFRVNGSTDPDFTAWRELNYPTNSATAINLTPGAGYFNLYARSDDLLSLQFAAILEGGVPIGDGSTPPTGGGGTGLPTIRYSDLMNAAGPYGVFAAQCISCHNANRADGGLNMATYAGSFNARVAIINRVQNSANPMPPGRFMSQTNRDIVQKWIDTGAQQ